MLLAIPSDAFIIQPTLTFREIYPGLIVNSEIPKNVKYTYSLQQEKDEVMSKRGFSFQELCTVWGITRNKPKRKDDRTILNTIWSINHKFIVNIIMLLTGHTVVKCTKNVPKNN